MPLIDRTYFIGEINIAGLSQPAIQASLSVFIAKREPEYLDKALGYAFAKLFTAGIGDTEGRWYDLKNGAEYTDMRGYLKKWTGFVNSGKQSPIANYIYWWYQRDNLTFTATVGEMEGKTENADTVSPRFKTSRAWNEMVEQTKKLHDFLLNKKDDAGNLVYDEFDVHQVDRELITGTNPFGI